jgi:hypothetical protein
MRNVKPLDETDSYVLFKEHEDVFLFDKDLNIEVWRTQFYGEAICGIVGLKNEWAVIGGEHLIVWSNGKLKTIDDFELKWIHDLRQIDDNEVEILIDPWSQNSSIWKFNVHTFCKSKIKDFKDYKDKPYSNEVKW